MYAHLRIALCVLTVALLAAGTLPRAAQADRPLLITVDDLPIAGSGQHLTAERRRQITEAWLSAFEKHGVKAIGFVRGDWIEGQEGLLLRWLAAGHELGNHTFSHRSLSSTPLADYIADAERGRQALEGVVGKPIRFFRFPFLREGDSVETLRGFRAYLARSGQRNVPVTIDTSDWSFARPWARTAPGAARDAISGDYLAHLRTVVRRYERLGDKVLARETPQILLLHANGVGADHIDALLAWLKATGHRFVGPDDVLRDAAFDLRHEYVGPFGMSLWWRLKVTRGLAAEEKAIRALLQGSVGAWNRGDLDAFTAVYADEARFVTATALTVGRSEVLARYRRRYPDRAAMGSLRIDITHVSLLPNVAITVYDNVEPVAPNVATVIGRWHIKRASGEELQGATTLVLHKRRGKWLIVEDHSS